MPRSLGNVDSPRDNAPGTGPRITGGNELSRASEWEAIREASKPEWARKEPAKASSDRGQAGRASHDQGSNHNPEPQKDSPDSKLVVVDRDHGLPSGYAPDDLVFVHPLKIPTLGGGSMKLRKEAAEAASRMFADARDEGHDLVVCSAYRSYDAQVVSYNRLTALHGEGAGGFSAPPGHSEHQLGTAIDISNAKMDYQLHQRFAETESSRWLRRNAAQYGFVLSYPKEAEEHTGYRWEPWHYRYIGQDNALRYRQGEYRSPQQFFLEEGFLPKG